MHADAQTTAGHVIFGSKAIGYIGHACEDMLLIGYNEHQNITLIF